MFALNSVSVLECVIVCSDIQELVGLVAPCLMMIPMCCLKCMISGYLPTNSEMQREHR